MGPGFPFPGGFDFSQLMRMLQSPGPVNLEVARQVVGRDRDLRSRDRSTGRPNRRSIATRHRAFDRLVRAAQAAGRGHDRHRRVARACRPARSTGRTGRARRSTGLEPVLEALAGALGRAHRRRSRTRRRRSAGARRGRDVQLPHAELAAGAARRVVRLDDRSALAPRARPVRPAAAARRPRPTLLFVAAQRRRRSPKRGRCPPTSCATRSRCARPCTRRAALGAVGARAARAARARSTSARTR